jgi:hypothetical protein
MLKVGSTGRRRRRRRRRRINLCNYDYNVGTSRVNNVDSKLGDYTEFELVNGFVEHLYIVTTSNYSVVAN